MFAYIIHLFFILVGGGMLLTGLIALGYGLYSMRVPGFDRSIRNVSLGLGIGLISLVLSVYFVYSKADEQTGKRHETPIPHVSQEESEQKPVV